MANNAAYYNEQASAPMRYPGFCMRGADCFMKRSDKSPKWAGEFVDSLPGDILETVATDAQATPLRVRGSRTPQAPSGPLPGSPVHTLDGSNRRSP